MTGTGNDYDVVVIGGGAAGLNGALLLARSRRSVLVIDAGSPRNAPAQGVHGLLGREGMPPAELLALGRAEVRGYGGQVESGEVTAAVRTGDGFTVTVSGGRTVRARRLLVTSGLADELPEIPGLRERWGRDVLHCPYCHGWEARDRAVGVLATGPVAVHSALLWRQLSDDVTLFTHTSPPPAADQAEQLAARGIRVIDGPVAGLEITGDRLTGIRLADGTVVARAVLAAPPRVAVHIEFLSALGLHPVDHPSGMGTHLPVDPAGRTAIEGVWAAGNVTDPAAQVGAAAAAGAWAAAQLNADLVAQETTLAVVTYRESAAPAPAR